MHTDTANLLKELLEADFLYYTEGKSTLSDNEYDRKREQFKALEPGHPYLKSVGAPVPVNAKKVTHRIVAGSQEKIKSEEELVGWAGQTRGNYVEQWKLDGATLVLQYTDGCLMEAASRGDGEVGESVLFNVVNMPSVPKRLPYPFTGDIRGEVVLSKGNFAQFFAPLGHSNPRNSVAVLRDQKGSGLAKHLDVVAFDLVELDGHEYATELNKVAVLGEFGFTHVETVVVTEKNDLWRVFTEFESRRSAYQYEVDGVVVKFSSLADQAALGSSSDNRPKGQRSIKFANDEAETTILAVELTIGSTGAIIPTAKVNPVECGGVIISSILMNNFKYIQEELGGACIGDKCVIERAGGVIPHMREVFPRYNHTQRLGQPIVAPEKCPFCGSTLIEEGAHIRCKNQECEGLGYQKVMQWVTKRDIKGCGDVTLQGMYDEGLITEPQHLYTLPKAAWVTVLGLKTAENLLKEIEKSKECPLNELMGSVCIKFLGRRECEIIMEKTGIDSVGKWFDLTEGTLLSIGGYKETKAKAIVAGIEKAKPVILALISAGVKPTMPEAKPAPKATTGKPFSGQTLLFTGKIEKCDGNGERYTRKKMQALAKDQGAVVVDDFMPGITMLITAEMTSTSSKMQKAKKAGVKIVSEEDFFAMLGV